GDGLTFPQGFLRGSIEKAPFDFCGLGFGWSRKRHLGSIERHARTIPADGVIATFSATDLNAFGTTTLLEQHDLFVELEPSFVVRDAPRSVPRLDLTFQIAARPRRARREEVQRDAW